MNRASVNESVKEVANLRKKKEDLEKQFQKEGWSFLKKNETLEQKAGSGLVDYFPIHKVKPTNTKFEVLKMILPTIFLMGVMERRMESRCSGLSFEKGPNRIVTLKNSEALVWNVMAVKIYIYSRKNGNKGIVDAVKNAVMDLKKINEKIYGQWVTRRLMDMYYFEMNTVDEFQISENMANMFLKFGDCVSGDEKLF